MENAADALHMAADVLIFVIAVSIAIIAFGQARRTADVILDVRDRETEYINGDYYYDASNYKRQVGLETIIPSITRAYLENYKIVFEGLGEEPIYEIKTFDGSPRPKKYSLDLITYDKGNVTNQINNVVLGNNDKKIEFLHAILYREFKSGDVYVKPGEAGYTAAKDYFETTYRIELPSDTPLYKRLKEKLDSGSTIEESLGVYYQSDSEEEPDVNKTKKRIITYTIN